MDALLIFAALAGAAAGFVASAVPGLHVNALALAVLAAAPAAGAPGVAFLVAALAASPFGLALGSTFLGGSSDDSALSSLPAHALAREGRAQEAVALQAWGALLGLLLALPLVALAQPALLALAPRLPSALPWLLVAVVALLVASEPRRPRVHARWLVVPHGAPGGRVACGLHFFAHRRRRIGEIEVADPDGLLDAIPLGALVEAKVERTWTRGPLSRAAGAALAGFALVLAGALGLAALPLGAASPLKLPGSPLLPLLAGLFAVPSLLGGLRARPSRNAARLRAPRERLARLLADATPGAAVSSLLGLVPGTSASHAALLAPASRAPERALVRLAAVNGGAVVFTLLAWHALAKARAGALVAAQALAPPVAWTQAAAPAALLDEAAVVVGAGVVGLVLARSLSPPLARVHGRIDPRRFSAAGLALLALMTALTCGAVGLAMLVAASLVGVSIERLGVRRSLGMGVLLVPSLLRAWGLA